MKKSVSKKSSAGIRKNIFLKIMNEVAVNYVADPVAAVVHYFYWVVCFYSGSDSVCSDLDLPDSV